MEPLERTSGLQDKACRYQWAAGMGQSWDGEGAAGLWLCAAGGEGLRWGTELSYTDIHLPSLAHLM